MLLFTLFKSIDESCLSIRLILCVYSSPRYQEKGFIIVSSVDFVLRLVVCTK